MGLLRTHARMTYDINSVTPHDFITRTLHRRQWEWPNYPGIDPGVWSRYTQPVYLVEAFTRSQCSTILYGDRLRLGARGA